MKVVVVESPAKARTINKYLGSDYRVVASYGHVRDLPPKDGSVRPDEDFAMSWEVDERSERHIAEIAKAMKGADGLYLATDPDREGEAISWHISEELGRRALIDSLDVKRVVFHEITRQAVLDAVANPRGINDALVEAYLARRALDYLVGFTLSPVLWRKLPGSRSAGRVQSVALRLICEREAEIEAFRTDEYWTIDGAFETEEGRPFAARLTHLDGKKLDKLAISTREAAETAVARLKATGWRIASVEKKQVRRHPQPPFTTSTLQQEASRKLRFGAAQTMRAAQRLYEGVDIGGETVGLITYMRTDSVSLAGEAVAACRGLIGRAFGDAYLPDKPRSFRNRTRNAQEAHEAIRPTDPGRRPDDVRAHLGDQEFRLYELIWKRTLASQMESAVLDQVAVDLEAADGSGRFRATGSVIAFDGFLKLYQEDRDDPTDDEDGEGRMLPPIREGAAAACREITPEQHFTQPPPRYTEASLVKKMEELGIGRPSTYASIVQVLQDRDYVRLDSRRFVPEDRGRLVTAFLEGFFRRYVEYNFTAELEQRLDDVSNGRLDWRTLLNDFWRRFIEHVEEIKDLRVGEVLTALDRELGPHFFPAGTDGGDPRACPACADGRLGLKLGRHGAFIGCSNYPDCRYTRPLAVPGDGDDEAAADGPRLLGRDPETGLDVTLRKGPFGHYVQLGEAAEAATEPEDTGKSKSKGKKAKAKAPKPKRASIPKGMPPAEVGLETALALLSLPREVGPHPESGKPIVAGIGRYGPYVAHDGVYKSLGPDEDVLTIGLNRAVTLIAEGKGRQGGGVLRELGTHPKDGAPVTINRGRFGPYVKHGRVMASLRKGTEPETMDMAQAVALLDAKVARGGGGKAAAKGGAKETAKTAAKSGTAKPRRKAASSRSGADVDRA